jgi:hypothetical protein
MPPVAAHGLVSDPFLTVNGRSRAIHLSIFERAHDAAAATAKI